MLPWVDHPRSDQSAELEQVMPVTPVAGEPRCIQAQYGPDLTGTEPCNEALEAKPRHPSPARSDSTSIDAWSRTSGLR